MKKRIKLILPALFIWLTSCAQLPTEYEATPSYIFKDTNHTELARRAKKYSNNTDESAAYLLNEGTDAFFARMALMFFAEKSIDVQYYIWRDDLVGKVLLNGMLKAADRGVRVRVLLDDININSKLEAMLYAIDKHKNIEVRLYNPFASRDLRAVDFVSDAFRMNRRMHNKSFTVDGQYTIIGGRNIGNEYFSADEESNFKDLDVMSTGPVVNDIGKQFDTYWNSKVVFPVKAFEHNVATELKLEVIKENLAEFVESKKKSKYALDLLDSDMYRRMKNQSVDVNAPEIFRGKVKVIYDDPEKSMAKSEEEIVYMKSLLKPHLDNSTKSFEIISPYFVPGNKGTKYLSSLVKKGIKVRVITNSLSSTDGIMAQSGYARQRIALLESGIELYELKAEYKTKASRSLRRSKKAKSGLHAKTYVFDRDEIFIGSFNFDPRSANINSEVGVIYQIPRMAEVIARTVFDEKIIDSCYKVELLVDIEVLDGIEFENKRPVWIEIKEGREIRHTTQPNTSGWRRFNEGLFSILPIESQL